MLFMEVMSCFCAVSVVPLACHSRGTTSRTLADSLDGAASFVV